MPPIHVEPGSVREFKNARRTGSRSGRKKKIATFAEMLKRGETLEWSEGGLKSAAR